MRASYRWLSDLVEGIPSVEETARLLTAAGLEVESLEPQGQGLERVVVGKVLSKEKVPGSDKLNVCRVDVGAGQPVQIVCGASNYEVGAFVPAALEGASLPNGMKIGKAKLKGVESFGMLCSAKELGLAEDASGLMLLAGSPRPGTPLRQHLELDDVALGLNVTPNRPDWLSHLGVARELAAVAGLTLKARPASPAERGAAAEGLVQVAIEDPERCTRYAARVVEGVKFGPSPRWMQARLETCGVRALGNVIDVTNYVLLELGHPLHAFDLDRVHGAKVVARRAAEGEKLVTLDGKERVLSGEDLVIADADRPLVLAGVMGGADAEVGATTTRVLLECAHFAPTPIRRTSRRHGLSSESSFRFEKGVDPAGIPHALDRAAELLGELCGAKAEVRRGRVDVWPSPVRPWSVRLRWQRVPAVLGCDVPPAESRRVLVSLGLAAVREDGEGATFEVPTIRGDLTRECDLIEEIARVRGFDAIPAAPPRAGKPPLDDRRRQVERRVREALASAGLDEVVNYSFVDPKDLALGARGAPRPALPLVNPLAETQGVMRTCLAAGLLRNVAFNRNRQATDVRLYEIGRVFQPVPDASQPVREPWRLGAVLVGRRRPLSPGEAAAPVDFFDAKGVVEAVLAAAGIRDATYAPDDAPHLHPRSACVVRRGDVRLGRLGELHPEVAEAFELPRGVFVLELALDRIADAASLVPAYRGVPRFPAVLRDVAMVVAEDVPAARIEQVLAGEAGGGLVEAVELFDVYQGKQVPAGKKSLAWSIRYRAPDRTLTDEEVQKVHGALLAALEAEVGAAVRT